MGWGLFDRLGNWIGYFCLGLGLGGISIPSICLADIVISHVTDLYPIEVGEGHLVHAGVLWEARNALGNIDRIHHLEMYDPLDLELLTIVTLPHSVEQIYPFGNDAVLVVGRRYHNEWQTAYSVVTKNAPSHFHTTWLPITLLTEFFAGEPGRLFFNEVGSGTISKVSGNVVIPIATHVNSPGKMVVWDHWLFAIERNSIDPGDENVIRIDLKTGHVDRTFVNVRNNLSNLIALGDGTIAVSETWANQLLVIDAKTNTLKATLPAPTEPRGLTLYGHCVVTFSMDSKILSFFDIPSLKPVTQWNLSGLDSRYENNRDLTVDETTGRFFLRSVFASDLDDALTGVFAIDNTDANALAGCR